MRVIICLATVLAFGTGSTQVAAKTAPFQLNKTTWTFTDKDGTKVRESVDAEGNYIVESRAGKHVDHGTAVMKDDKACFTSAMTKEGEVCWTTKTVKIGNSLTTTSDKGEKLKVTRVAYRPLKMPK
jgi:predicted PilT family ATPase